MNEHPVTLRADEAIELGELLVFCCDWLGTTPPVVGRSLAGFVGAPGYGLDDLRVDLQRFAFLLGVAETYVVAGGEAP